MKHWHDPPATPAPGNKNPVISAKLHLNQSCWWPQAGMAGEHQVPGTWSKLINTHLTDNSLAGPEKEQPHQCQINHETTQKMVIWVPFGHFLLHDLFIPKGSIPKPQVCTSRHIWRAGHADFFLGKHEFPLKNQEYWAGEDSHLSPSMHCGWVIQWRFCQCKAPTKYLL